MSSKLEKLFKQINLEKYIEYFDNSELEKIIVYDKTKLWEFVIIVDNNIPSYVYTYLNNKLSESFNVDKIDLTIISKNKDNEYLNEYFNLIIDSLIKSSGKYNVFKDREIIVNEDNIEIKVYNKIEKAYLLQELERINDRLRKYGYDYKLNIVMDNTGEDELLKQIEEDKVVNESYVFEEKKEVKNNYREKKSEDVVLIKDIKNEIDNINIEIKVFGIEIFESKSGYKIFTLKVTDGTDSMYAKIFTKSEDEFARLKDLLKEGKYYRFYGKVVTDEFAKELVFNTRFKDITAIDGQEENKRVDDAKEKRVELHAHTMMSQMDGVCDEVKLVKQAIKFGHPGIAITDHDCCQAFPHVFGEVTSYNKGLKKAANGKIEEIKGKIETLTNEGKTEGLDELNIELENAIKEKDNLKYFKVAYGSEIDMCESYLNVCFNPNDELIENNTFVIFDTETTGFNPGLGDSMIELGAVKLKNGEVVDRFDELINPGHHIDEEITRVTDISDDDVKDSDNEENVVKRFKEWIGTLPLVAHNARFDKNMLDMAYYKYDLGKLENPIIDTLMLSRVINRDLKKHSLKALGKFYGINTGEADEEDEENASGVPSDSVKLDNYLLNKLEDIKVDGESILKTTEEGTYLNKVRKASKTETCHLIINLKDNNVIEKDINLHPAENEEVVNIDEFNTIKIKIYVGQHHGADVDSENTGYIFAKMLKQIEGINKISELNDLNLLEEVSFKNDPKKLENIYDLCSYKNYVEPCTNSIEEDEKRGYPFIRYNNKEYIWKYPWCHDNYLQMYENIPGKTITEHIANLYDNTKHVIFLAKDKVGLKNLFKIISYANTNFIVRNAKIPRKLIEENREGLLIGSACLNGEIFYLAETRNEEDLMKAMEFYDYIEVQPIENYSHLLKGHDINNIEHLKKCIKKIIDCAKKCNKLIVATGDVHNINKEDVLYREIIVNQNVPGKGRHPLARYLSGNLKGNVNNENIENLIEYVKTKGVELTSIDVKVLKYIYTLTNVKDIPITLMNLVELYQIDKNNKEEEILKSKEEYKKSKIEDALRKFQSLNIIELRTKDEKIVYSLVDDFRYYEPTKLSVSGHIPNQFFRTTNEMKEEFSWLEDEDLINEIVVVNPNKILDMINEIEVVEYPDKPYSPIIEHSQETCRDLVYTKAHSMYGNPLPRMIEERIAQEFYGDTILGLVKDKINLDYPDLDETKKDEMLPSVLHDVIMSGYDGVVNLVKEKMQREDNTLTDEAAIEKAKASLGGIIGGGFDVIYLIAQKLVKHSNDDGYLVGSRGSVGSSLVANMMGITECNGLPAHYYCPNCGYSIFNDEEGNPLSKNYASGFDLPERMCPKCESKMVHEGNDMPFATFLGFNADKVPDIDLNFSGDNQASAHEYTKVLFGTDNVYRAGTIGTVADKTAYGYVLGFYEEQAHNTLKIEANSYGISVPSKDDLKKKKLLKVSARVAEVERVSVGCTGVKRTTGQHPGGIVVVPGYKDVWDFTPFQYPADDPTSVWRTTHFDYHAIDADLLKLDILGHDDPTVLRKLQDLSGIDVTKIDLGDRDTMKIFCGPEVLGVEKDRLRGLTDKNGRKYCPTGTLGIPEFGTSFLLGMLEETKPTTFAELIKISGLSHGTDVWLGNARDLCTPDENGEIKVPFKDVIGCRDDIMVNLIAWGMKPAKAFKIMEFVRKGKASKDPATWEGHVETMREAGIPEWYIESCKKIKYMFPKAHATAYVTSAFRIAWFKVHHPIYYYAAYFSIRCDQFDPSSMILGENGIRNKIDEIEEKIANKTASKKEIDTCGVLYLCLEMCARGFYFKNIDIDKSDAKDFVITEDGKGLYIPFRALDGLGESVAEAIVNEREKSTFISIEDFQKRCRVSQTLIDKMKIMGLFNDMSETNQLSLF